MKNRHHGQGFPSGNAWDPSPATPGSQRSTRAQIQRAETARLEMEMLVWQHHTIR